MEWPGPNFFSTFLRDSPNQISPIELPSTMRCLPGLARRGTPPQRSAETASNLIEKVRLREHCDVGVPRDVSAASLPDQRAPGGLSPGSDEHRDDAKRAGDVLRAQARVVDQENEPRCSPPRYVQLQPQCGECSSHLSNGVEAARVRGAPEPAVIRPGVRVV